MKYLYHMSHNNLIIFTPNVAVSQANCIFFCFFQFSEVGICFTIRSVLFNLRHLLYYKILTFLITLFYITLSHYKTILTKEILLINVLTLLYDNLHFLFHILKQYMYYLEYFEKKNFFWKIWFFNDLKFTKKLFSFSK